MVLPNEMPEASLYLSQKKERPQTSKPMSNSKKRLNVNDLSDANMILKISEMGRNSVITANNTESLGYLTNNKSVIQKKAPRERLISAKLTKDKEKLPPPPFGKTMGHGLM